MTRTHPRPPKERTFLIWGYKPVNRRANEFIQACDLGTDGLFYKFAELATITVSDNCTPEMLERQPGAIVEAYTKLGCRDVKVHEVTI